MRIRGEVSVKLSKAGSAYYTLLIGTGITNFIEVPGQRIDPKELFVHAASVHHLYIRNYFFSGIANISLHIPAAIPKYGHIIGNPSHPWYTQNRIQNAVASSRKYRCSFAGTFRIPTVVRPLLIGVVQEG
jgi:ATP-dependent phosphoenolpyruvate carboxykinase